MNQQGGDDLEDDFIPDDLVVLSGGEEVEDASDFDGDLQMNVDEAEVEGNDHDVDKEADGRKRKRREKIKESKAKKRKLVETLEPIESLSIAEQSPIMLADYLSSMQAKSLSKMSGLELEDMQVPDTSIVDTTMWTGPRTLDQLPAFITKVLPTLHKRLSQKSKSNGAPTLIFVTSAALRVADVTRILRDKQLRSDKGGEVAKLFAKRIKLKEHVAYLKRTKVGAAAGTPGRIGRLLCDTDALSLAALTHVILDITFKDAKKRSLLDIPETRDEFFKLVMGCPKLLQAIKQGTVQVVLF